jgi:hypothetical protein
MYQYVLSFAVWIERKSNNKVLTTFYGCPERKIPQHLSRFTGSQVSPTGSIGSQDFQNYKRWLFLTFLEVVFVTLHEMLLPVRRIQREHRFTIP